MNARDDADSARRRAVIAKRLLTGDCILNVPSRPLAVWGGDDDGDELLWAARQALIIVGTDGTGKTTIAGNLVQARLGLTNKVLGQKVRPGERNVLVLLM